MLTSLANTLFPRFSIPIAFLLVLVGCAVQGIWP